MVLGNETKDQLRILFYFLIIGKAQNNNNDMKKFSTVTVLGRYERDYKTLNSS